MQAIEEVEILPFPPSFSNAVLQNAHKIGLWKHVYCELIVGTVRTVSC